MIDTPKPHRKKSGPSPTARTLAECRKRGWIAQVVERVVPHSFIKQDLFGCIDIVAITPDGILGIQATSGNSGGAHAARRRKILAEPRIAAWLEHAQMQIWSWSKMGKAGKRKLWTLREETIERGDFQTSEQAAA